MFFVFGYCIYGVIKILVQLPRADRLQFYRSLVTPATALKNVKDIFLNCLLHVKLWKRNPMLGFMHSSIAFGWFMLIVLGHVEVFLFVPERIKFFIYPRILHFDHNLLAIWQDRFMYLTNRGCSKWLFIKVLEKLC